MTLNAFVLFLHLVGMLLLFVSLAIEWITIDAGGPLSTSSLRKYLRLQSAAAVLIVASGTYLAARFGVMHFAWVRASFAVLLVMAATAGLLARSQRGDTSHQAGQLWRTSVVIRVALGLGAVYLMVAKSDLSESLTVLGIAFMLGIASTALRGREPAIRARP